MQIYKQLIFLYSILFFLSQSIIIFSTPGDLDITFNSTGSVVTNVGAAVGKNNAARAVVIDDSNNFVVAGTNGIDFALARYTSAGVLDGTFGTAGTVVTGMGGANDVAYGVAIQSDGKIVAAGTDGAHFALARYTTAGVLDTSFGTIGKTITTIGVSTSSIAYGIAITSSDNIIVAGTDGTQIVVAKYFGTGVSAGTLDPSFGSSGIRTTTIGATAIGYALSIQADGKIVVAGSSGNDFVVARYTTSGNLDTTTFGSGFGYVITNLPNAAAAYAITLQTDGKIVVSGKSGSNFGVARYTTAGVLDPSFGAGAGYVTTNISGTDVSYGIKVQTNGAIVAVGKSANNFVAVRYTTTGALDTTFGGGTGKVSTDMGGTDVAYACVINSSGNILLVGSDGSNFALAQYTTNGILNTAGFGSGTGKVITNIGTGTIDGARACAIQLDGKVVVVGLSANNFAVLRYTINGVLDTRGYCYN